MFIEILIFRLLFKIEVCSFVVKIPLISEILSCKEFVRWFVGQSKNEIYIYIFWNMNFSAAN